MLLPSHYRKCYQKEKAVFLKIIHISRFKILCHCACRGIVGKLLKADYLTFGSAYLCKLPQYLHGYWQHLKPQFFCIYCRTSRTLTSKIKYLSAATTLSTASWRTLLRDRSKDPTVTRRSSPICSRGCPSVAILTANSQTFDLSERDKS